MLLYVLLLAKLVRNEEEKKNKKERSHARTIESAKGKKEDVPNGEFEESTELFSFLF